MLCLKCHVEMRRVALKGILADFCPECRSFWLDKGELDKIRKEIKKSDKELKAEAAKEKKNDPMSLVSGACPRCFGEITTFFDGSVKLERCDRCEGMFFDKDELDECLKQKEDTFLSKITKIFWRT